MSGLKDEWANILKLRESGTSDDSKKDQIKSRIFNNFISSARKPKRDLAKISEISEESEKNISEFQIMKSTLALTRNKTPEPAKKFEFGLKNVYPPQSYDAKDTVRTDKNLDIWKIDDFPYRDLHEDPVPDKYELLSLAEFDSTTKSIKSNRREICIFSDLSPITRYMCNMTLSEEETFVQESSKHEKLMHGHIHLLHLDPTLSMLEKLDWKNSIAIALNFSFKYDILTLLNPSVMRRLTELNMQIPKDLSQLPIQIVEYSSPKHTAHKSSIENILTPVDELTLLEQNMIEMMEMLNQKSETDNVQDKLQSLLEIVEEKMKDFKDPAMVMQIKVLYQFLVEYKKAKESHKKPANEKRMPEKKKTQPKGRNSRRIQNGQSNDSFGSAGNILPTSKNKEPNTQDLGNIKRTKHIKS